MTEHREIEEKITGLRRNLKEVEEWRDLSIGDPLAQAKYEAQIRELQRQIKIYQEQLRKLPEAKIQELCRQLLLLNFKTQSREYRYFNPASAGLFLIYGNRYYGHKWVVNLLLKTFCDFEDKEAVKIYSLPVAYSQDTTIDDIVYDFCEKFDYPVTSKPEDVFKFLCEEMQQRHTVLVLEGVLPQYFVTDFWQPFTQYLGTLSAEPACKMRIFLLNSAISSDAAVENVFIPCVPGDQVDRQYCKPVRLSPLKKITPDEIRQWWEVVEDSLYNLNPNPVRLRSLCEGTSLQLLTDAREMPERVLAHICEEYNTTFNKVLEHLWIR